MPKGIYSFTSTRPGEHDSRGSQHQGPDGRHNPYSTCHCPNLKFNSIKHKRTRGTPSVSVRHSIAQETPVPMYTGVMLHAHTHKMPLIDWLSHLSISLSNDLVLQLSAQMGNSVCQQFHREQVVFPPTMHGKVFTTVAVDNIDHNSSATSKGILPWDWYLSTSAPLIEYLSTSASLIEVLSLLKDL